VEVLRSWLNLFAFNYADLKRDSKKPAGAVWRRKGHPDNADKISASIFVNIPLPCHLFLGFGFWSS